MQNERIEEVQEIIEELKKDKNNKIIDIEPYPKNNHKFYASFSEKINQNQKAQGFHRYYFYHEFENKRIPKILTVIMYNPSNTEVSGKIDPTVENIKKMVVNDWKDANFSAVEVLNLFSYVHGNKGEVKKYYKMNSNKTNLDFLKKFIDKGLNEYTLVAWGADFNNIAKDTELDEIRDLLKNSSNVYTFCRGDRNYPKHPGRIDIECCRNCYGRKNNIDLIEYKFE